MAFEHVKSDTRWLTTMPQHQRWPHASPGDAAEPRDFEAAASSAAALGPGFTQRTDPVAAAWLPAAGPGKGAGAAC